MKKWFFILAVFIIIVIVGQQLQKDKLEIKSETIQEQKDGVYTVVEIDEEQMKIGNLLLINAQNQLDPKGIASDLITINREQALDHGYSLSSDEVKLSQNMLAAFHEMMNAAHDDNINQFLITSGYRSLEHQAQLYEDVGSVYALPAGYSEHNSGLALDISSTMSKMEVAPEGKWLQQHGAAYGFILRYPEHKQHITGIGYEPWHFRYVGLPHSLIMQERDLVLEEYIEFLADEGQLTVNTGDETYTITHYNYEPQLTIKIEPHADYEISGDNVGGIIVTTRERLR